MFSSDGVQFSNPKPTPHTSHKSNVSNFIIVKLSCRYKQHKESSRIQSVVLS